jgi:hypothetical protein
MGFELSPDGKAIAYLEAIKGEKLLRILNLETNTGATVDLVGRDRAWTHNAQYFWITDDRLVYRGNYGFEAINWDGSKGIVDTDRVSLIGDGSWAGLLGLITLAKDANVWACGVVRSPRTDWTKVIDPKVIKGDFIARYYERLGNPANSDDPLSQLSPIQLVDEIKAPLLVVDTFSFKPNHYTYLKDFVEKLEESGSVVEFKNKYKQKYGFEVVGQYWEDTVAFLDKHMPASR